MRSPDQPSSTPGPEGAQTTPLQNIAGVIVAGGLGSRLAYTEKPLLELDDTSILQHIIDNVRQQLELVLLNVNRKQSAYKEYGLPVIDDLIGNSAGPLAGLHAAMSYLRSAHPHISHLACFPGDTPWFPRDVVARLVDALQTGPAEVAWLRTAGQLQPLFSLWSLTLLEPLEAALLRGHYSPRYFIESRSHTLQDLQPKDGRMFFNINTPQSLEAARSLARED